MEAIWFLGGFTCGIAATYLVWFSLRIFFPWFRCFLCGAPLSMVNLLGMYLRGSPVKLLTDAHIGLVQSGKSPRAFRMNEIEAKYLASPGRIFTAEDLMNAMREEAVVGPQR